MGREDEAQLVATQPTLTQAEEMGNPPAYDDINPTTTVQPSAPLIEQAYPTLPQQQPVVNQAYHSMPVTVQPTTVVATVVPNSNAPANQHFKYSLFDCCSDCSSCCNAWCCPCFVHYNVAEKTGDNPTLCCLVSAFCCPFNWIITCYQRGTVRNQNGYRGSECDDCCVSYWCTCCALAQLNRETRPNNA